MITEIKNKIVAMLETLGNSRKSSRQSISKLGKQILSVNYKERRCHVQYSQMLLK